MHGRLDVIPVEDEQLNEPYYRISVVDITEKKKADQEKMLLQQEVLKSQKELTLYDSSNPANLGHSVKFGAT